MRARWPRRCLLSRHNILSRRHIWTNSKKDLLWKTSTSKRNLRHANISSDWSWRNFISWGNRTYSRALATALSYVAARHINTKDDWNICAPQCHLKPAWSNFWTGVCRAQRAGRDHETETETQNRETKTDTNTQTQPERGRERERERETQKQRQRERDKDRDRERERERRRETKGDECCVVLCFVVLWCVVLGFAVLFCLVLRRVVFCYVIMGFVLFCFVICLCCVVRRCHLFCCVV